MAWLEAHQALERHPKLIDLAARMEWTRYEAMGRLLAFWFWCLDFAPSGDLRGKNDSVIAGSVGLAANDSKRFVDAMVESCWIDRTDEVFRVHDWIDYAGRFLRDSKFKRRPELWQQVEALYGRSHCLPTVGGQSVQPTYPPTNPPTPMGMDRGRETREAKAARLLAARK